MATRGPGGRWCRARRRARRRPPARRARSARRHDPPGRRCERNSRTVVPGRASGEAVGQDPRLLDERAPANPWRSTSRPGPSSVSTGGAGAGPYVTARRPARSWAINGNVGKIEQQGCARRARGWPRRPAPRTPPVGVGAPSRKAPRRPGEAAKRPQATWEVGWGHWVGGVTPHTRAHGARRRRSRRHWPGPPLVSAAR